MIWSRLNFWDKVRFFRWWVLCTFVAIITNVVASVMRLVHSYNNNQMGAADDQATMLLDGIGIALLYIQVCDFVHMVSPPLQHYCFYCSLPFTFDSLLQVVHYFEHRHEYFQLIATLQIGIPRVLKFLVGVAPLLIAYNFVGMIFFANYS